MKAPTIDIEALLKIKNSVNIQSSVIKSALAKAEQEKNEELEREVMANIARMQKITASAVDTLKKTRAVEKASKEYLTIVAGAEQQYLKDADYEAYKKEVSTAYQCFNEKWDNYRYSSRVYVSL